jgi:hypothetical protein
MYPKTITQKELIELLPYKDSPLPKKGYTLIITYPLNQLKQDLKVIKLDKDKYKIELK